MAAVPLSVGAPRRQEGWGMTKKLRDNPVYRLPDSRITVPLAQACPRCGARTRSGALQVTRDAEWPMPDARRQKHWPAHGRGGWSECAERILDTVGTQRTRAG